MKASVRIGGASGFWGDSSIGAPQLVEGGAIDYLVFDYLAELTMSIMAAQKQKNPEAGFALDFVTVALKSVLKDVAAKGIRVISNAGGVNPAACARLIEKLAAEEGVPVKVAVVEGDDVSALLPALRGEGVAEMQTGKPLPERVLSANAYFGALPIKAALDAGAQIVVTGRCVDSAVTLGALMHEFGWSHDDYDRLAAGSLAGHIIECGAQATGGLFTDWESVPGWDNIGYPVVECLPDGSFTCGKPPGTGGLVSSAVIAEQILYEIHDPGNYILPDVICDFRAVSLTQTGPDLVRVSGARGRAPTPTYKVSATYMDGFKSMAQLSIVGFDAPAKARRTGEALLARTRALFARAGLPDYTATNIEALGAESAFGPHASANGTREAIMRLAVRHPSKAALEIFAKEFAAPGTSFSPGTTGGGGGRPDVAPSIKQYAFLIDKSRLSPEVTFGAERMNVAVPAGVVAPKGPAMPTKMPPHDTLDWPTGPALIRIAHGRSGDKGDISNIGIIARNESAWAFLRDWLTPERVASYMAYAVKGPVTRYELTGLRALNFVCEEALGGGGMASLRNDPLGKGMAQILLSMPLPDEAKELVS
ncbi:MAG: acyclic terpene utilization AtuA family protein [Burkholderiales bacterium]